MKLERITVQAFRGYPRRADMVFGGDIVLLYGDNGAGKTSLTEGLEWALFGTVVRKARSKTPGEFRGWAWLRSAHAPDDLPTFSEVELVDSAGVHHVVRRELVGAEAVLTIDGRKADDVADLGLRVEDAFRPFLGQCEIQALIDSEQQDRWEQLSAILGFGDFGRARTRLQRLRTDTDHDARVKQARELATRAVQPLTPVGSDPLAVDPEDLRKRTASFLGLPEDSAWPVLHAASRSQLEALYARDRRPAGLDRLVVEAGDLRSAASDVEQGVGAVLEEVQLHRAWHRENAKSAFAQQGLALRDADRPEVCPYCGESTLTDQRVASLRTLAGETAMRPRDSREQVRANIAAIGLAGPANVDVVSAILGAIPECEEAAELRASLEEQSRLAEQQSRLLGLLEGFMAATDRARQPDGDSGALASLGSQLCELASSLAAQSASLRARIEAVKVGLVQRFTSLSEDERKTVASVQKAQLLAENAETVLACWRVRNLQEQLAGATKELERAEKERMANALKLLGTDIRAYYEELSPGHHITITGVSVRDTKHRQAVLEATSFGKPVNPVTAFSEAEGNCLGLSLYFSQRVDRNPGWRMILLDDPVQSMDAGHEQGLLNVLSRVGRERQVVVMTHDREFAQAVEAQFAKVPSFTRYNLYRTADPEPRVEVHAGRLEELLKYAEQNAGGEQALRESCAGAVRKAVERMSRDLAAKHGLALKRKATIEDMVDSVHGGGALDAIEAGTLHRLRRFGTKGAHDDVSVNAAEPAIRAAVAALRGLQRTHLAPSRQLHLIEGGGEQAAS